MSDAVERAKIALGVKSDLDMSRALGVAASAIGGYKRRNTVPLEQCIKIANLTGVSLDWLILGKGEHKTGSAATPHGDEGDSSERAHLVLGQKISHHAHTCASNGSSTSSVERAKTALGIKSDYELARRLNVTPSSVGGYRKRDNTVPLEQCIKIANLTGVSLDWLILGKVEQKTGDLPNPSLPIHAGVDNGTAPVSLIPLYDTAVDAGCGGLSDIGRITGQVPFDSGEGGDSLTIIGACRIRVGRIF